MILRMGSTGDDVRRLQQNLASLGFGLNGTGFFGPATDTAVESFQRRAGLKVDGIVGRDTLAAIASAVQTGGKSVVPAGLNAGRPIIHLPSKAEISRPLWLEAGMRMLGTKEVPGKGDNPTIMQWAKDEGGAIEKAYTHDSIPWCALGANHILTKVGLKGTETLWALDFEGKWPSVRLPDVAVGAFAPMLRDGGGHIICIVGKDQHGNVMGWGCNQTDQVSIVPFARTRLNRGFWWPEGVALPKETGMASLPIVRSDGKVSSNEA